MKNWRPKIIFILILILGAAIISRLIFIQVLNNDFYEALAQGQQELSQSLEVPRGEIYIQDRHDHLYLLATNKKSRFVFASPKQIAESQKKELSSKLSSILGLNKETIAQKLQSPDSLFEVLKKNLTDSGIEEIKSNNLAGIYLGERKQRFYPQEFLAGNSLGFLGGEGQGQYGLEGYYEKELKGEPGELAGKKSCQGNLVFFDLKNYIPEKEGTDLILGLDYYIQREAEEALQKAKQDYEVKEGQILVVDPHSGQIIALAEIPKINPNRYSEFPMEEFTNEIVQEAFEPGSVFKPIIFAAALDKKKITPTTKYVDKGHLEIGGDTINNYAQKVWGERTMTEVLEKSINTGAVFVSQKLSSDTFLQYVENFGFFEKTGIDLQGEIVPPNRELKQGREINFATASFGQGIEMTPIQLVRAFCAIANGGKLIQPHLVDKIVQKRGETVDLNSVNQGEVISSQTSAKLTAMLVSVVENGFGKRAQIPHYYIAGKTGTAQIPFSALGKDKKGYSKETWQTFIGYAPAFNPQFLIMVRLKNPNTKTAEYSAAPLFHNLAKYIINYWQIPPTNHQGEL